MGSQLRHNPQHIHYNCPNRCLISNSYQLSRFFHYNLSWAINKILIDILDKPKSLQWWNASHILKQPQLKHKCRYFEDKTLPYNSHKYLLRNNLNNSGLLETDVQRIFYHSWDNIHFYKFHILQSCWELNSSRRKSFRKHSRFVNRRNRKNTFGCTRRLLEFPLPSPDSRTFINTNFHSNSNQVCKIGIESPNNSCNRGLKANGHIDC